MFKILKIKYILLSIFSLLIIFDFYTGCAVQTDIEYSYEKSSDLNKNFDWYISQMNTGTASTANCGPAAVSMALKYTQNRDVKVEDVRNLYYDNENWWNNDDIKNALSYYGVSFIIKPLKSKKQLMKSLSHGHILIIGLNMSLISEEVNKEDELKYNRFYNNVTGHFIILKGYLKDQKWFLCYDSNNWGDDFYSDKNPKGKNRLYSIDEVYNSMSTWNTDFFEL